MPIPPPRAISPSVPRPATHVAFRAVFAVGVLSFLCLGSAAATAQEAKSLRLAAFDGNPAYLFGTDLPLDAKELPACASDLAARGAARQGVAADGISLVLLEAVSPKTGEWSFTLQPGCPGKLVRADSLDRAATGVATLAGSDGRHRAFAVYVPPADFPTEASGDERPQGEDTARSSNLPQVIETAPPRHSAAEGDSGPQVDVQLITIEGVFHPVGDQDSPQRVRYELKLVRRPVVLIHGLYHNPRLAWQTAPPEQIGTSSMQQMLESRGFRVFMVDYERTNGRPGTAPSRLRDNQRVIWENPGGIREALSTLRSEGIACTQVDVVGHSMGGLLTRAYIRGRPLPEAEVATDGAHGNVAANQRPTAAKQAAESWYLRPDNYHQGDVRRLITLCTPHAGSDLVRLFVCYGDVCRKLSPAEQQQATQLFKLIDSVFSFSSGAILDQEPESNALQALGATKVAAHAIACTASPDDFANFRAVYRWTFLAMYCFVPSEVWEATFRHEKMQQPEMAKKLVDFLSRHDRLKTGVMMRLMAIYAGGEPPTLDDRQLAALQTNAVKLLCEGIFRGRPHDGAVSVRSALGGLPRDATSTLDGILHSWAARYPAVQDRVVELLEGPASNFHADGFPAMESPQ